MFHLQEKAKEEKQRQKEMEKQKKEEQRKEKEKQKEEQRLEKERQKKEEKVCKMKNTPSFLSPGKMLNTNALRIKGIWYGDEFP